jgi:hypothetical protein
MKTMKIAILQLALLELFVISPSARAQRSLAPFDCSEKAVTGAQRNLPAHMTQSARIQTLTTDQLLTKYIAARGGAEAIKKILTLSMRATSLTKDRARDSIYASIFGPEHFSPSLPTKRLGFYYYGESYKFRLDTLAGESYSNKTLWSSEAFDGNELWTIHKFNDSSEPVKNDDPEFTGLIRLVSDNKFFLAGMLNLQNTYTEMSSPQVCVVDGKTMYVVDSRLSTTTDEIHERLMFNANTFLLVRRDVIEPTVDGQEIESTRFSRFEWANGVAFPTEERMLYSDGSEEHVFFSHFIVNAPMRDKFFTLDKERRLYALKPHPAIEKPLDNDSAANFR